MASPYEIVSPAVRAPAPARSGRAVPPLASRVEALERVQALLPRVRARAERTEADRRVPAESIEELLDAGLFSVVTPKAFGGAELGFRTLVETAAALGSACGSTGWVYGVLTGHAWMTALFAREAQAEVFADSRALTASVFRLNGTTAAVAGGYRLTGGEGRFCSGIDYAQWVIVGTAVERGAGPPEPLYLLIPVRDVEIVDDWYTAGMRGTGSRSIRIAEAFVPAHRAVRATDLSQGTSPGAQLHRGSPVYGVPFPVAQPFSLIGTVLGMARGALDSLAEPQAKRFGAMPPEQAAEQGALFARLARAAAQTEAAESLILSDAARIDSAADPAALPMIERSRIQRDLAYAAQTCRHAVNSLFEAGGGSGIYDSSTLQRIWRDVSSATAHTAFNWDQAATQFGRARLGVPPSRFSGPRR